jgi:hypothetical protein
MEWVVPPIPWVTNGCDMMYMMISDNFDALGPPSLQPTGSYMPNTSSLAEFAPWNRTKVNHWAPRARHSLNMTISITSPRQVLLLEVQVPKPVNPLTVLPRRERLYLLAFFDRFWRK